MYEEDILVDPTRVKEIAQWGIDNGINKRAAVTDTGRNYRWPDNTIKYKLDGTSIGILFTISLFGLTQELRLDFSEIFAC